MNDLNALNVFLVLMQTHSTQRAAAKLGRSQSYVSKILAKLREDLDDPLFTRSSEGLSPTSYALSIEPRLRHAVEQVNLSIEPEQFSPKALDKICLHIAEPYLLYSGKQIIQAIRSQSDAIIDIRQWNSHSEHLLLADEVDLGLHILSDKPQSLYQKRLHSGTSYFTGNQEGEYVKFMVPGVNDYSNPYQILRPEIEASIYVDNYALIEQLMDECYTLRYRKDQQEETNRLRIDIALIIKASRKDSAKIRWLTKLIQPIVDGLTFDKIG